VRDAPNCARVYLVMAETERHEFCGKVMHVLGCNRDGNVGMKEVRGRAEGSAKCSGVLDCTEWLGHCALCRIMAKAGLTMKASYLADLYARPDTLPLWRCCWKTTPSIMTDISPTWIGPIKFSFLSTDGGCTLRERRWRYGQHFWFNRKDFPPDCPDPTV
jgi:hypothetical protein